MAAANLQGRRFEKLFVVDGPFVTRTYGKAQNNWLCHCDCGTWRIVPGYRLTTSNTKSCGCIRTGKCRELGLNSRTSLAAGENGFNETLRSYRGGAANRNLTFDLTTEQFRELTQSDCHYCAKPPSNVKYGIAKRKKTKEFGAYIHNGIDRLDSSLGYFPENCVPCCTDCNRAKLNLSHDDFINLAHNISKNHSNKETN